VVVARSYGGEVATDLALRYPDRARALVLLEAAPVELLPVAAEWTRAFRDRLREVAAASGEDAIGEELIRELAGEGAWGSLPHEARLIFTHNGPAVLADLQGDWLKADAAALAAINQPVLLIASTDSAPQLREPNEAMAAALPQRPQRPRRRRPSDRSGGARGARVHRRSTREPVARVPPPDWKRASAIRRQGSRVGRGRSVRTRALLTPASAQSGSDD
jgi:pimeloyl-ACP methyl ester carboxylesterase